MSAHSLSNAKANSFSPSFFAAKSTLFAHTSVSFLGYNFVPRKLNFSARKLLDFDAIIRASDSERNDASDGSVRWVLEPIAKSTLFAHTSVNFLGYNFVPRKLNFSARKLRDFGAIRASDSERTDASDGSVRWVLEPIGNGDSKHIGYKIAMPGAFQIVSNVVTVGRDRDKADIVISVPTVSGLHARIQKTKDNLLITDLDSTNGTFIDEKRLLPGVVFAASPGNLVTFGDTNLAIFRVYRLEKEEFITESEKPVVVSEGEPNSTLQSAS